MSLWALTTAGGLYMVTAIDLFHQGKGWLALAFVCYAIANFGLGMATR